MKTLITIASLILLVLVAPYAVDFYDATKKGYYIAKIELNLEKQECGRAFINGALSELEKYSPDIVENLYNSNTLSSSC